MYGYYGVNKVENVHLPEEKHDFGINKRIALYDFLIKNFKLNNCLVKDKTGKYDESKVTIERKRPCMFLAIKAKNCLKMRLMGFEQLEKLFPKAK